MMDAPYLIVLTQEEINALETILEEFSKWLKRGDLGNVVLVEEMRAKLRLAQ